MKLNLLYIDINVNFKLFDFIDQNLNFLIEQNKTQIV